jgi:LmbE family N-acetylglucosaminyl deacetylase
LSEVSEGNPPASVLAVMAHPDDAEFTSAGTLAKWTSQGTEVRYVLLTSGNGGSKDPDMSAHRLADIREAEQLAAAQVLGVKQVIFLRENDGELDVTKALRNDVALLVRHFKPTVILTHDPWRLYQIHPDHRAAGTLAMNAVVAARDHLFLPAQTAIGIEPHAPAEILLWASDNADFYVDITETIELKFQALAQHHSQVDRIADWRERVSDWAKLAGEKRGSAFAEGFKRIVLY